MNYPQFFFGKIAIGCAAVRSLVRLANPSSLISNHLSLIIFWFNFGSTLVRTGSELHLNLK